jgi:NAD(P)H-hydrate epimerase
MLIFGIHMGFHPRVKPDMLIYLIAPNNCAQFFKGKHHFLGGRIVPKTLEY